MKNIRRDKMKYIIFILLISGFLACDEGPYSNSIRARDVKDGYSYSLFNNADIGMKFQVNGQEIINLQPGECVVLLYEDISTLSIEEDDSWYAPDNIVCSNVDAVKVDCIATGTLITTDKKMIIKAGGNSEADYMLVDLDPEAVAQQAAQDSPDGTGGGFGCGSVESLKTARGNK